MPIIKDINKAIINKSGINVIDTLANYDIKISTNDFIEMYNIIRGGILVNNYDKALTVLKTYIVEKGLSEIDGFELQHYSNTVGLDTLSKDK